jgi:hypothetical protein
MVPMPVTASTAGGVTKFAFEDKGVLLGVRQGRTGRIVDTI